MNKGFLSLIDLSYNMQRALLAIRDIRGGVAAVMVVGITVLACGLLPLVWYFDISPTVDYADLWVRDLAATLPATLSGDCGSGGIDCETSLPFVSFAILFLTMLPTLCELLLPRIGANVRAAAFLIFLLSGIDAVTDWPRVAATLRLYEGDFMQWGIAGRILWWLLHPILLLFATFLFELLFVLCLVLIVVLVFKIGAEDSRARRRDG